MDLYNKYCVLFFLLSNNTVVAGDILCMYYCGCFNQAGLCRVCSVVVLRFFCDAGLQDLEFAEQN